jgi:PAS domain S-box-containing protein
MKSGHEFVRRNSGLVILTYVLLVALAAMSALSLYLVEKELISVTSHAFALAIVATAVLPLAALLLWSARRLRSEWSNTEEREHLLMTTLRSIGDAVMSVDAEGRITFLNPVAERLTGWAEASARGLPLGDVFRIVHTTTRESLENAAVTAMRRGQPASSRGPICLLARDGAEHAIADNASPIRNDEDEIVGCVLVFRDVTERELADSALQASQEMFAMITDHVSDMITVLDLQGRRLYNSASYERLLAPPSGLYLTDSFASLHPDDRERIKHIFDETVRTGVGQRTEYRLIDKRGTAVHIESVGNVIRGPDNRPQRVLVVSRDITERRQANERVRQEKEFSEQLINSMPGIFYLNTVDRKMLRWNRNFETVTGYSGEEIAQIEPLGFFPPEQRPLVGSRMAKVFETGQADVEASLVCKHGQRIPFYLTGVRIQIDGQPCLIGVGIDITERLEAEETVRRTMRRLGRQNRALSEHARTPSLSGLKAEDAFRRITEVAAETLEVSRASIWFYNDAGDAIRCVDLFEEEGKKHSQGLELAARDYPAYFAALAEERAIAANDARSDPNTREFTPHYLTPLGITSMLDAPIRSSGKMVGVLCNEHTGPARAWTPDEQNFAGSMADLVSLSLEIIQREQAEAALREERANLEIKVHERTRDLAEANERLQELDRLKSEFLATMSHELRTPLNSIIGFTGILRQGLAGPLNEEQLKQLGMVHFSARHLLGLINDLLDLSRIESGKMEVVAEDFPLEEAIGEVVQSLTPTAVQKKLTLETHFDEPQLVLHSDRKKTFQIFLNLTNNALKFTERGGVRIDVKTTPAEVIITVSDTGIGIRPESIAGLFQAFRQVDGSARRTYEGTGLGLYLCKKLSSMLGGSIRAESEFGVGSRFTVTLPREIPANPPPA